MLEEIIGVLLAIGIIPAAIEADVTGVSIARASNRLGDDLYGVLAKKPGNIAISPFSAYSALTLLTLGASGKTKWELLEKLSATNDNNLKRGYGTSLQQILDSNQNVLHIGSTLFCDKSVTLRETFKTQANAIFKATPQEIVFKNTKRAVTTINKWVANQTRRTISEIVSKDSVSPQTILIMLNALYFKAKWQVQFDKSQTVKDYTFHTPKRDVKCHMMVMKPIRQSFFSTTEFFMLSLPFANTGIRIAFVKSLKFENITHIDQKFNHEIFSYAVAHLKPQKGEIRIPSFKLGITYELKKYLKMIGIRNIFGNPNLSKMYSRKLPIHVDGVNQKTVIQISETGVKAAALTTMNHVLRSAPQVVRFILDSPFLFFLYDSQSEIILIRGRVENPNSMSVM